MFYMPRCSALDTMGVFGKRRANLDTVNDRETTTFVDVCDISGMLPALLVDSRLRVLLVYEYPISFPSRPRYEGATIPL